MLLRLLDRILALTLGVMAHIFFKSQLRLLLQAIERKAALHRAPGKQQDFDIAVQALIAGEDRRFYLHFGVDTRGLLRAVSVYLARHEIQGASTVTQQLVRVITHDYRRSIGRKLKELCLAAAVDSKISKREQAELYLSIAYFGWRMNGFREARRRLKLEGQLTQSQAAELVARLRYPEPAHASKEQLERVRRRAAYIETLMQKNVAKNGKAA